MRNSNEKATGTPETRRHGLGVGNPHKLYNKISVLGLFLKSLNIPNEKFRFTNGVFEVNRDGIWEEIVQK